MSDFERFHVIADGPRVCEVVVVAYAACGHDLVALPLVSVDKRVRFVLATIGAWKRPVLADGPSISSGPRA